MGRDTLYSQVVEFVYNVSIHAPAWGATLKRYEKIWSILVSIHAPAWGATVYEDGVIHDNDVSIHAPAWGATHTTEHSSVATEFQSTRPHGARPTTSIIKWLQVLRFNPRARMGRDVW